MGEAGPSERFEAFVENLSRSGLIDSETVQRRLVAFGAQRPLDKNDPAALDLFAARFVFDSLLTDWQCRLLREGKWGGFFLDGHLFLGRVGHDELFAYYLARNLDSGEMVIMRITPPSRSKVKDQLEWHIVWRLQPAKE